MSEEPKTAPSRGTYTVDGLPYQVNAGDPLPEGAEFVAAEEEATAEPATGGKETTKASGPKEKA